MNRKNQQDLIAYFFESFHHEFEFQRLLIRLHGRLNRGGRMVFCGEPVVEAAFDGIPYPWGSRLDALSVYCMRKMGWMELGCEHNTFVGSLNRCGWKVQHYPLTLSGRAHTYVAEPILEGRMELGKGYVLGKHDAGFHAPEGTHRWTRERSTFPLPVDECISVDVEIEVSNFLPYEKSLKISSGDVEVSRVLAPGEAHVLLILQDARGETLDFESDTHFPSPEDARLLGVAVHGVRLTRRIVK